MKFIYLLFIAPFIFAQNGLIDAARKTANHDIAQLRASIQSLKQKVKEVEQSRFENTGSACQGRLTLQTGVAIPTTDQTSSTIYFTPYHGDRISLYNGSIWKIYTFTERSLALAALTASTNYDVFIYDNAGTPTLELTKWTSDTVRATALVLQDGIWSKTGVLTRRYLGTLRTTAASTTTDAVAQRFLWNYYNRVPKHLRRNETTNSWSYGTATWRQVNATAANKVEFVMGVAEERMNLRAMFNASDSGGTTRANIGSSFGLDATNTVVTGALRGGTADNASIQQIWSELLEFPSVGYHTYYWNEIGVSTVPDELFYGDNGDARLSAGVLGYYNG